MGIEDDERVFAALADPTRRKILLNLVENSPKTATQLAQAFPITRQGIIKHLDLLADAGLVQTQVKGREKQYVIRLEPLDGVKAWLDALGAKWDARLARLKAMAESDLDVE